MNSSSAHRPVRSGQTFAARLCLPVVLVLIATLARAQSEPLRACVEDANYPPFTYFTPQANSLSASGSTPELLRAFAKSLGRPLDLVALPQARCLDSLERGDFVLGLDFFLDTQRRARYGHSIAYHTLEPRYFWSRQRFAHGPPIKQRADLKHYKGCGLHGYSYEHYDLASGPRFDTGANTHEALIKKLLAGRCDFFVEELDVIQGYHLVGRPNIAAHPQIASAPLADVRRPTLHFLISRRHAAADDVRTKLDAFIRQRGSAQ